MWKDDIMFTHYNKITIRLHIMLSFLVLVDFKATVLMKKYRSLKIVLCKGFFHELWVKNFFGVISLKFVYIFKKRGTKPY